MSSIRQQFFSALDRIGADTADNHDIRLQKALLARARVMFVAAGAIWELPILSSLSRLQARFRLAMRSSPR